MSSDSPPHHPLRCGCCSKLLDDVPTDVAMEAPWKRLGVTDDEFARRVRLTSEFCVIDEEIFLVRCVITLPILGTDKTFGWGVWCSLSKDSYERFLERWDDEDQRDEPRRFGWVMSELPGYADSTWTLKAMLQLQDPRTRPLAEVEPGSHQLADEQHNGISVERWHELIRLVS